MMPTFSGSAGSAYAYEGELAAGPKTTPLWLLVVGDGSAADVAAAYVLALRADAIGPFHPRGRKDYSVDGFVASLELGRPTFPDRPTPPLLSVAMAGVDEREARAIVELLAVAVVNGELVPQPGGASPDAEQWMRAVEIATHLVARRRSAEDGSAMYTRLVQGPLFLAALRTEVPVDDVASVHALGAGAEGGQPTPAPGEQAETMAAVERRLVGAWGAEVATGVLDAGLRVRLLELPVGHTVITLADVDDVENRVCVVCHRSGLVSWSPSDASNHYCAAPGCRRFFDDLPGGGGQ